MASEAKRFEESLAVKVIETGRCLVCGACVVTCPFNCLEYSNEKPFLVKECKACGICPRVCPQYAESQLETEKLVFDRERRIEEEFGVYRRLVVVQAKDASIRSFSQDGGVVTALLTFALETGLIDSAIVSGIDSEKPFFPVPKIATTSKEILESAGTRYFYSPNILALPEAIKQKKTKIAFVGTPCQIRAIRKMQLAGLKKLVNPLSFVIGLMCSECFVYDGLVEKHIKGTMGANISNIKKMNIKGKMIVTTDLGIKTISLAEIKQCARKNCHFCSDFSSELADISVGGLGLEGWTFTIIRTEKGEALFSKASTSNIFNIRSIDEEPNALTLLNKLSKKKRDSSKVS